MLPLLEYQQEVLTDYLGCFRDAEKYVAYEAKDALRQFKAGWLYNRAVDTERRKEVDKQLLTMRIKGEVS